MIEHIIPLHHKSRLKFGSVLVTPLGVQPLLVTEYLCLPIPLPIVLLYLLARKDYNVATAANDAKALEVARNDKPDLIILDITLPV